MDPIRLIRIADPIEFNLLTEAIEQAEEELKNDRQDLAVRIARALAGKSS